LVGLVAGVEAVAVETEGLAAAVHHRLGGRLALGATVGLLVLVAAPVRQGVHAGGVDLAAPALAQLLTIGFVAGFAGGTAIGHVIAPAIAVDLDAVNEARLGRLHTGLGLLHAHTGLYL